MNKHCFRLVISRARAVLVPAPECARRTPGSPAGGPAAVPRRRAQHGIARLHVLAAAAMLALAGPALANPSAPTVVNGSASFVTQGNKLTVTNSAGAIINWGSFSIAPGETARFNQVNANSAVLNRVTGVDPSQLLGTLSSNGKVFVINPNGMIFGAGATIDTQGFLASTLNISDKDFIAGRLSFSGSGSGQIVNQGHILGGTGDVMLIAPHISNSGAISTQGGNVVLAAGQKVELTSANLEGICFEVQAPSDQAVNLGSLSGSAVGVFAGTLSQAGQVQATRLTQEGGRIVLKAQGDTRLEAGSVTTASGSSGGNIQVLGQNVTVASGASVDASGQHGGGSILVGGDLHGANPRLNNALNTHVEAGAILNADAIDDGNGGKVVVWADQRTDAAGAISARGGANGGDGGMVEVSGKQFLAFHSKVDTRAAKGKTGTLLLDPNDLTISDAPDSFDPYLAAGSNTNGDSVVSGPTSPSNISWANVDGLLAMTNLVLTTSGGGSGLGDITLVNGHDINSANKLSLLAHRNINVNGTLQNLDVGDLTLMAGWREASGTIAPKAVAGTGTINVNGSINFASGGNVLLAAGGDINIFGGFTSGVLPHLLQTSGTFSALAAGNITLGQGVPGAVQMGNVGTGAMTFMAGWDVASATSAPTAIPGSGDLTLTAGSAVGAVGGLTMAAGRNVTLSGNLGTGDWANLAALGAPVSPDAIRLLAGRDVILDRSVGFAQSNAAFLGLYAGWDGVSNVASPTLVSGTGNLAINSSVTRSGNIELAAGGDLTTSWLVTTPDGNISAQALGGSIKIQSDTNNSNLYAGFKAQGPASVVTLDSAQDLMVIDNISGARSHVPYVSADTLILKAPGMQTASSNGSSFDLAFEGNKLDFTLTQNWLAQPLGAQDGLGISTIKTTPLDIVNGRFSPNEFLRLWTTGDTVITGAVTSPTSGPRPASLTITGPGGSTFATTATGSLNNVTLNVWADQYQIGAPITAAPEAAYANSGYLSNIAVTLSPATAGNSFVIGAKNPNVPSLDAGEVSQIAVDLLQVKSDSTVRVVGATSVPSTKLELMANNVSIEAPLTMSKPDSLLALDVAVTGAGSLAVGADVNVGQGGILLTSSSGGPHQGGGFTNVLGLPDGQAKPGGGAIELTQTELHHLHTTGGLFVNPAFSAQGAGNDALRIAGPIDMTGIANQLFLVGDTITADAGAVIKVPELAANAYTSIDLSPANQVGKFAARVWSNDTSSPRFIKYGSDANGTDIATVQSLYFAPSPSTVITAPASSTPGISFAPSSAAASTCSIVSTSCNVTLSSAGTITESAPIIATSLQVTAPAALLNAQGNLLSILHAGNPAMTLGYTQSSLAAGDTLLQVDSVTGTLSGQLALHGAAPMGIAGSLALSGISADSVLITRDGGSLAIPSGATVSGVGTVDVSASGAPLAVGGTLAPGAISGASPVGTLKIVGDLALAPSAALNVRLDSAGSDVLAVSGNASLDGTVNAGLTSGFSPAGQSFDVLSFGTRTGSFSAFYLPVDFQHVYGAGVLSLYHSPGSGSPYTSLFWDNDSGDNQWTTAVNWSSNALPISTNDVTIDSRGAGTAVHMASGNQTVHNLSMVGKYLWIDGGNLTVNGTFANDKGLFVNGGTLTANGVTQLQSAFLGSGTLTGSGDITIGGTGVANPSFSWTGGTLAGTGAFTLSSDVQSSYSGTESLNRALTNSGAMSVYYGTTIGGSGSIANSGTMTLVAGAATDVRTIGVPVSNSGTISQTGPESTQWNAALTSSAGSQFDVLGGSVIFSTSSTLGNAVFNTQGGMSFAGVSLDILGTAVQNANIGAGTLLVHGTYDLQSGTLGAATTVKSGGLLKKTGGGTATIGSYLVEDAGGTISVEGGTLNATVGGTPNAWSGQVNIGSAGTLRLGEDGSGTSSTTQLNGSGTINVSGVLEATSGTVLTGTGQLNVQTGGKLSLTDGTANAVRTIGVAVANAGVIEQTGADALGTTWNGTLTSATGSKFNLLTGDARLNGTGTTLADATLTGGSTLALGTSVSVTGALDWNGGSIGGLGKTLTAGGAVTLRGQDGLNSGTMDLTGTAVQNGIIDSGTLLVHGTYDLQSGTLGAATTVKSGGVLKKTGSSIAGVTGYTVEDAGGTISVEGGTLTTIVSGTVNHAWSGQVNIGSSGTLQLGQDIVGNSSGVSLNGAGALNVSGVLEATNGTLLFGTGQVNVLPGGKLSLTNGLTGGSRTIFVPVSNAGVIEQTSAYGTTWNGTITSATGSQFNLLAGSAVVNGTMVMNGSMNLTTAALTVNGQFLAGPGSNLAFSAGGTSPGQFGQLAANSISLDPTGVNVSLASANGYLFSTGDRFKVLSTTGATPSLAPAFSYGAFNATGPANYLVTAIPSATDMTLQVGSFVPISLPGSTGAAIVGAGGVSGFVQGQSATALQSFLAAAQQATTAASVASITLP